jgi:hypothetical protein
VEKEEPVQDNFNADLSANVLRLGQPRSGSASTGRHKFLERVVRHDGIQARLFFWHPIAILKCAVSE